MGSSGGGRGGGGCQEEGGGVLRVLPFPAHDQGDQRQVVVVEVLHRDPGGGGLGGDPVRRVGDDLELADPGPVGGDTLPAFEGGGSGEGAGTAVSADLLD